MPSILKACPPRPRHLQKGPGVTAHRTLRLIFYFFGLGLSITATAAQVLAEMGRPFANTVELVSFHTVSKGVYGECGLRGGYMEFTNIDGRCGVCACVYLSLSVS